MYFLILEQHVWIFLHPYFITALMESFVREAFQLIPLCFLFFFYNIKINEKTSFWQVMRDCSLFTKHVSGHLSKGAHSLWPLVPRTWLDKRKLSTFIPPWLYYLIILWGPTVSNGITDALKTCQISAFCFSFFLFAPSQMRRWAICAGVEFINFTQTRYKKNTESVQEFMGVRFDPWTDGSWTPALGAHLSERRRVRVPMATRCLKWSDVKPYND